MTILLFVLAVIGWLLAVFFLVLLSIVSLVSGAMQAERTEQLADLEPDDLIWDNKKGRTTLWNMNTTRENPLSD